jgi:hypothetical protein
LSTVLYACPVRSCSAQYPKPIKSHLCYKKLANPDLSCATSLFLVITSRPVSLAFSGLESRVDIHLFSPLQYLPRQDDISALPQPNTTNNTRLPTNTFSSVFHTQIYHQNPRYHSKIQIQCLPKHLVTLASAALSPQKPSQPLSRHHHL